MSLLARRCFAIVGLLCAAKTTDAQVSSQCTQLLTQDACQKTLDIFAYVAPQLGTVIAGGSAVLGQASILSYVGSDRPLPPVSIGLRVNALRGSLPRVDRVNFALTGASNNSPIEVKGQFIPGPAVDAAVGVFGGFDVGPTNILSFDALASAFYLPDISEREVQIRPEGSGLKLGWGGRVGLLQESIVTPGISASFLHRALPTLDITAQSDAGSNDVSLEITDLKKSADSWRVILSKSFLTFQLAAGAGQDRYDSRATIEATVNALNTGAFTASQNVTRTNLFLDLTLLLGPIRASAEVGRVSGGEIATFNSFAGTPADAARYYGSLGLRITL